MASESVAATVSFSKCHGSKKPFANQRWDSLPSAVHIHAVTASPRFLRAAAGSVS